MVLKIVRYLGQQGYGTDKLVILTPYLGQLRELKEALKKDNDPVLNDLDSYDLVHAGLMTSSAAKMGKRPIKIATIGMILQSGSMLRSSTISHPRQLPRRRKRYRHYIAHEKQHFPRYRFHELTRASDCLVIQSARRVSHDWKHEDI